MSKYYLLTQFTPAVLRWGTTYRRIYPNAPSGFAFHDTEGDPLTVREILRPLAHLSSLFDSAKSVIILRLDPKTLVATFSTAGMPYPAKLPRQHTYSVTTPDAEWVQTAQLKGWLVSDVTDPTVAPVPFGPDDFYDQCIELVRFSAGCPCSKVSTGECATNLVLPNLPPGFSADGLASDYSVDDKAMARVRYKELSGFTRISGARTTHRDFVSSYRPWDAHDFSIVESRSSVLKNRGSTRKSQEIIRKTECDKCYFAPRKLPRTRRSTDCGAISQCNRGVTADNVRTILRAWYQHSGFGDMEGFTDEQRDYLTLQAGKTYLLPVNSTSRRIINVMAGFTFQDNQWQYCIAAAKGDLLRRTYFPTWASIHSAVPSVLDVPSDYGVAQVSRVACAVIGYVKRIYAGYPSRPLHVVRVNPHDMSVTATYVYPREAVAALHVRASGEPRVLYEHLWGLDYASASSRLKQALEHK